MLTAGPVCCWPGNFRARYYIFPDGISGWQGCQHGELRANYNACVAYLQIQDPVRLPTSAITTEWINTVSQKHLDKIKHLSENVAKTIGASFLRVDWFVDDTRIQINELTSRAISIRYHPLPSRMLKLQAHTYMYPPALGKDFTW